MGRYLNMKEWYKCPYCKQNILKYATNAESEKIYIICKKCKREIEVKIKATK